MIRYIADFQCGNKYEVYFFMRCLQRLGIRWRSGRIASTNIMIRYINPSTIYSLELDGDRVQLSVGSARTASKMLSPNDMRNINSIEDLKALII